jgi:hypothetical protein
MTSPPSIHVGANTRTNKQRQSTIAKIITLTLSPAIDIATAVPIVASLHKLRFLARAGHARVIVARRRSAIVCMAPAVQEENLTFSH